MNSNVFKYFCKQCLHYLNEVFIEPPKPDLSLRYNCHKLKQPLSASSFNSPALRNEIPEEIKRTTSLNTLEHNIQIIFE